MGNKILLGTENYDPKKFVNNSGNGFKIPVYEFKALYGRRDGILVLKKDKDGKQVYKNLYQEIQNAGIGQDIQTLLQNNPNQLTDINRGIGYGDGYLDFNDRGQDISNLSDMEWDDYLNAANDLRRRYGKLDNVDKKAQDLANRIKIARANYLKHLDDQKKLREEKNNENK